MNIVVDMQMFPGANQKVSSSCFKLHRFNSISVNLSNVGEFFWR